MCKAWTQCTSFMVPIHYCNTVTGGHTHSLYSVSDLLNVLGVLDVVDCEVVLEDLLSVQSQLTQILHQHTHLGEQGRHYRP